MAKWGGLTVGVTPPLTPSVYIHTLLDPRYARDVIIVPERVQKAS